MAADLEAVSGFTDVASWFGRWPSFHDAEILEICLKRAEPSFVSVLTWQTHRQLDERGLYLRTKHAVVVFLLDNVQDVSLEGFSQQNVISGLQVQISEVGVKLHLHPCFGLSGTIEAEGLRLELKPQIDQS